MRDKIEQSIINRRMKAINARADALTKLSEQVNEQLYPPGGIQARTISEWIDIGIAIWRLMQWCSQAQEQLDAIDNLLEEHGSTLSADERNKYNDLGEETWEDMGKRGCFAH